MFGLWNIFSPYSQRKTNTLSLMKVYFPTETLDENIFPRCFSFSFNFYLFQFWRKSIIRLYTEVEFWFLFFVFVVKSIKTFNKSLVNVVWEVFENTFLKTFLIKGWMNFFWEEVEWESEDEQMKKIQLLLWVELRMFEDESLLESWGVTLSTLNIHFLLFVIWHGWRLTLKPFSGSRKMSHRIK